MGVFKSSQMFPITVSDLTPVANDVTEYFKQKGFEVAKEKTLIGGWDISITKSGIFKTVLGLKSALKVEIEPMGTSTNVKAGVGVFGAQVVPVILLYFVGWPILVTQIWGLIQNSKLDEEALECARDSLVRHSSAGIDPAKAVPAAVTKRCVNCGEQLSSLVKFCHFCGTKAEEIKVCSNCNNQLPVPVKFCPACGAKAA